ncbi:hypothetical protein [Streptomyces sp. 13-12-16]|uniref:hypothetical protein n=1 Tax=Streptomyces sp. 13-12-16 TaxID=1570823 RepID=UPI00117E20CC|nr:hypothetical protein [Streptomyces sp. 13-12-16]
MLSLTTMGAVDFRSDKERIARKTAKGARASKKTAKEAKRQSALLEEQNALLAAQAQAQPQVPAAPSPGSDIAGRLQQLDGLRTAGAITESEYQARRTAILNEI